MAGAKAAEPAQEVIACLHARTRPSGMPAKSAQLPRFSHQQPLSNLSYLSLERPLSPTVICTRSQSSSELQARETPRREFCAGPQRRGGERVRTEPAGAHPLVDSRYRHLAARERCGRLSPSGTRRSLPMRAPQPWPCSSETDWRLWRGHLDHVQMPNRAALKREADAGRRESCAAGARRHRRRECGRARAR